jgi:hypothetical protein
MSNGEDMLVPSRSSIEFDVLQSKPCAHEFLLLEAKPPHVTVSKPYVGKCIIEEAEQFGHTLDANVQNFSIPNRVENTDFAHFSLERDRAVIDDSDKLRSTLVDANEDNLPRFKQVDMTNDDDVVKDPVNVINDIFSKIKPDIARNSCKTIRHFVHMPISPTSHLYEAICSAAKEYPISHCNGYSGSESSPTCVTSYILSTDPSYDRHASVKVYTDFGIAVERLADKMRFLYMSHMHNCSVNSDLQKLAKQYGDMVIQLDDNFTNRFKRPPEGYYASKLLPRHVNRQLRIHSTIIEDDSTTYNYNSTIYNCQQLLLTGLANPRYNIDSYAFKISTESEMIVDTRPVVLCDLSCVTELDLEVKF